MKVGVELPPDTVTAGQHLDPTVPSVAPKDGIADTAQGLSLDPLADVVNQVSTLLMGPAWFINNEHWSRALEVEARAAKFLTKTKTLGDNSWYERG